VRNAIIATSESLSDAQARRPGVPSGTSLLGIMQHLTGVERHWFRFVFAGEDLECNMSMEVPPDVSRAELVAAYRDECARSNAIVFGCPDLSTVSAIPNPGEDDRVSLRAITAHMIEETARHAGQADILREQIDGATEL
jgi:uncharacterized damage-inducible protein DinB